MKWMLRFYDAFDGWIDIKEFPSQQRAESEAQKRNDKLSANNKQMGEYYRPFPSNTRMVHTPESRGR